MTSHYFNLSLALIPFNPSALDDTLWPRGTLQLFKRLRELFTQPPNKIAEASRQIPELAQFEQAAYVQHVLDTAVASSDHSSTMMPLL